MEAADAVDNETQAEIIITHNEMIRRSLIIIVIAQCLQDRMLVQDI
jgi:hypothetical protein